MIRFMVKYGNDVLYGEDGDDILWGDDNQDLNIFSNDKLYSGLGRDTLIGGGGFDTYYFNLSDLKRSGDDDKWIEDRDNRGEIVISGNPLIDMDFFESEKDNNIYQSQDERFVLTKNEHGYVLTAKDFGSSITIANTPVTNGKLLGMNLVHKIVNMAPFVITNLGTQKLIAGQEVHINLNDVFVDLEDTADKLVYSLTGLTEASGLHFDPNTRILSGTATESGFFHVTLTATDTKGLSSTMSFDIAIHPDPATMTAGTDVEELPDWMMYTPMQPPLPILPKYHTSNIVRQGGVMGEEIETKIGLPTLEQLGLSKEEIGLDLGIGIHGHHNHLTSVPEPIITSSHDLIADKTWEVGVMGV